MRNIDDVLSSVYERDYLTVAKVPDERDAFRSEGERLKALAALEQDMRQAAANLEFERAASIRDRLKRLRSPDAQPASGRAG